MPKQQIVTAQTTVNVSLWLSAANEAIRRECGWHVAPSITETLTLDASGGRELHLRSLHVTDVAAVVVGGVDITRQVSWSESGLLRWRSGRWPDDYRSVEVTLTHGWPIADVPELATLILTLAKRGQHTTVVASQSALGSSVSYLTAGGAPLSIPLLQIEKDALAPYRLPELP